MIWVLSVSLFVNLVAVVLLGCYIRGLRKRFAEALEQTAENLTRFVGAVSRVQFTATNKHATLFEYFILDLFAEDGLKKFDYNEKLRRYRSAHFSKMYELDMLFSPNWEDIYAAIMYFRSRKEYDNSLREFLRNLDSRKAIRENIDKIAKQLQEDGYTVRLNRTMN